MAPAWRIRAFCASDEPYIVDTWVRQIMASQAPSKRWREHLIHPERDAWSWECTRLKRRLREVLKIAVTTVACLPDDSDAILGYLVRDGSGVTLMAYTRSSARNLGIQKDLGR